MVIKEGHSSALRAPVLDGLSDARGIPRQIIAALFLLALAVVLAEAALSAAAVTARAVEWGGVALAAYIYGLYFVLMAVRGSGHGWLVAVGPWMILWAGTTYGLATLTLGQSQSLGGPIAQIILANVVRALWLVAAGFTVWMLGYLLGPGSLLQRAVGAGIRTLQRRFTADVRSLWTPWLLYGIGTAARLVALITTGRSAT